eukprot:6214487-Pleurochrysis_carterae.AAC.4
MATSDLSASLKIKHLFRSSQCCDRHRCRPSFSQSSDDAAPTQPPRRRSTPLRCAPHRRRARQDESARTLNDFVRTEMRRVLGKCGRLMSDINNHEGVEQATKALSALEWPRRQTDQRLKEEEELA